MYVLSSHNNRSQSPAGIYSTLGLKKQRPSTGGTQRAATSMSGYSTSGVGASEANTPSAAPHHLPSLNGGYNSAAKQKRVGSAAPASRRGNNSANTSHAVNTSAAANNNSSRPSTPGKDERLVAEHRDKSNRLVQLWELLAIPPETRQHSIGNSLVLAIPTWQNLLRIRQLIEHLENEYEDRQTKAGLYNEDADDQSNSNSYSQNTSVGDQSAGFTSSAGASPASNGRPSTGGPSSRVARHKAALNRATTGDNNNNASRDSLYAAAARKSEEDAAATRKLQYSNASTIAHEDDDDDVVLPTPGVSPVKKHSAPETHHTATGTGTGMSTPSTASDEDLAAYADRQHQKLLRQRKEQELSSNKSASSNNRSRSQGVDASTSTDLTPEEKMQRSLAVATSTPTATTLDALFEEESEKRSKLLQHAVHPVDALFLLHCHRLIQIEENDGEAAKNRRMRRELSSARISYDAVDEDEDANGTADDTIAHSLHSENSTLRALQASRAEDDKDAEIVRKGQPSVKKPKDMSEELFDSLQNLGFEEELRRLRLQERGISIPRTIYSLIAIQHEADRAIDDADKEEVNERSSLEEQFKLILTTKLDGPPARRLHRLLYTGQYRIEGEEKSTRTFIMEDFETGMANVFTTGPLCNEESKSRAALQEEYDEDVEKLNEYDEENKVLVRVRQASREATELDNIEAHEKTFRTYVAQNEGDARDVIACEHDEIIIREEMQNFSLSTLQLYLTEHHELIQRIGVTFQEDLSRLDEIHQEAERELLNAEEVSGFAEIPNRIANEGVYKLVDEETAAREVVETEQQSELSTEANALIQSTIVVIQEKEFTNRDEIEVIENESRVDIHAEEQGGMTVTMITSAALTERKEDSAATMIQAFGKRTIETGHRNDAQAELEKESTLQEEDLAARIVTRSFRRAGAKNQGVAFAALAVAQKEEQEKQEQERLELEAKKKKEQDELDRFSAAQKQIFVHYSELMTIATRESNNRMDFIVEEGSARLMLLSLHREELEPIATNERAMKRLVNEEAFYRLKLEDHEEGNRIDTATRREVGSDVNSVISRATDLCSQSSQN